MIPDGRRLAYPEPKAPTVRIKVFEGIGPLGSQLGVFPKKAVPDAILDTLFGQAESTETGEAGGNGATIPAMQTYAILDAAKVPNLPELLERSGLEHRCLFKGAAHDEMRDVAPWIVLLHGSCCLKRRTASPSTYSPAPMRHGISGTMSREFMSVRAKASISNTTQERREAYGPFRYEQPERDAHQWVKRHHFITRLNRHLENSSERFAQLEESKQQELSWRLVRDAANSGVTIERAVTDYATASILLWQDIGRIPAGKELLASNLNQLDKGKGLLRIAASQKAYV